MDRIKQLLKQDKPVKWLFTGDSITHGASHTFGWRDYVQVFEERARYELGRVSDVVIRTGISGWTTRDAFICGWPTRFIPVLPDTGHSLAFFCGNWESGTRKPRASSS